MVSATRTLDALPKAVLIPVFILFSFQSACVLVLPAGQWRYCRSRLLNFLPGCASTSRVDLASRRSCTLRHLQPFAPALPTCLSHRGCLPPVPKCVKRRDLCVLADGVDSLDPPCVRRMALAPLLS